MQSAKMWTVLVFLAGLAGAGIGGELAPFLFESGDSKVHLLELYSSQGCSSCPPAQHWVSRLRSVEGLWQRFVPVVFHVDYWDRLGWKDPYARAQYSARQRHYARAWHSQRIYTPMYVLNGREWRRPDKQVLLTASDAEGTLKAERLAAGACRITYVSAREHDTSLVFHCVLLGMDISTNVSAGENAGRALTHDFLVLDYRRTQTTSVGKTHSGVVPLVFEGGEASESLALAFWVSERGDNAPLQAVGGSVTISKEEKP